LSIYPEKNKRFAYKILCSAFDFHHIDKKKIHRADRQLKILKKI